MHWFDRKRRWTLGVCIVASILVSSVAAVQADIFTYRYQNGNYNRVSSEQSAGGHMSVICYPGFCYEVNCDACHTAGSAAGDLRARGFDGGRHFREYFPPRTVQLSPGQSIAWGDQRLERRDGAIALVTSRGEALIRFPADTVILGDRSRRPAFLVWSGDRPPAR
jgi:hypothetical protein